MTRLGALRELLTKVKEGGDVYDFGVVGGPTLRGYAEGACVGSLDAAKKLHEAVLPGWRCVLCMTYPLASASVFQVNDDQSHTVGKHRAIDASNEVPARAWLIAILEALIAMEEDKE